MKPIAAWMRHLVMLILALSLLAPWVRPQPAAAWGSLAGVATHQFILDQAYAKLKADKAFDPSRFPTLEEIQANEGVNWSGRSDTWFDALNGPGPDSEGASAYSKHYYNPDTTEGDGPSAVAEHYRDLAQGVSAGKKEAAKDAAWGAHFLADMFVPFHVVGATVDTARQLYNAQGGSGASSITYDQSITGPTDLCYKCAVKSWVGAANFKTETERFLSVVTTATSHLIWFDPWYYNGNWPAAVKSSSHVVWEGVVTHPSPVGAPTLKAWSNARPAFGAPWDLQKPRAEALARTAARTTRDNLVAWLSDDDPALNNAVHAVYQLWRASFSALRPDLEPTPNPAKPGTYKVKGVVTNVATEAAQGVRLRLTVTGGKITGGAAERDVKGSIFYDNSTEWEVEAADPAKCMLKLEVIGSYATTPDLQYAMITKPLGDSTGALDLIFCIDVTSSMSDDIASAKAAASNVVATIASKNSDFRVALIAYRDWNDTQGLAMFHDFPFSSDRDRIIGNINSLSVGGGDDEPEAVYEALMRAIAAEQVGGWRSNVNKVVILMGDAPPHIPSRQGYTAAIVAKAAEDADPVVIHAIAVARDGAYSEEAVQAFQELSHLTKGSFSQADNAEALPGVLQKSIAAITPAPPSPMGTVLCLGGGFVGLIGVLGLVIGLSRRKKPATATPGAGIPRRRTKPTPLLAALVLSGGPHAGRLYPLGLNQRLGQAEDNLLVLRDPSVAPYHAQIYAYGTAYAIADLGSASGTWVNGLRIAQPTPLREGDQIVMGSYYFTFTQRPQG